MNELVTVDAITKAYGSHFLEGFARAAKTIDGIKSWQDVETVLLKGQGLAATTYKTYLSAVRGLYEYTEGLNPFQVTPGHIEAFYDAVSARCTMATAYNKMMGLKRFFRGIAKLAPGWVSPFDVMEEPLVKKLTRQSHRGTKEALSRAEIAELLGYLVKDRSIRGVENHAIVLMLVTSGLRAAELCGLTWADISIIEGTAFATFRGKGDKPAQQPLYGPAVTAAREYFRRHFRRDPRPTDHIFYTIPVIPGAEPTPLDPHALWYRVKKIGKIVKGAVIHRDVNFSPHLFRRSYATSLYKSGMKLKAIQELTRHSDIQTLADHYIDDREDPSPYLDGFLTGGAA